VRRRRTATGLLAALLALAGLALGCGALRGAQAPPASLEEQRAYAEAVAPMADDPQKSRAALAAFLAAWPGGALADDAACQLAELELAAGDEAAALSRYEWVVRKHPRGDRVDAARVELARLQHRRGEDGLAASALRGMRLSRLSDAERRDAYRVLADIAADPAERLRWLARLRAEGADEDAVALVDVEIDELIQQMDEPDLVRAAGQLDEEVPAARLWLRAADLALDRGELDAARKALARAERLPLEPAYQGRLTSVSQRLRLSEFGKAEQGELPGFAEVQGSVPSTAGARGTLGVVLPLSGPFANFGEESLQGVLLAAGVFGGDGASQRVRVLVRDTGGDAGRAALAVRELAEQGVSAIVGPLLSDECEAAAAAAEEAGVPLLALTARAEVSVTRPHVFRVRTMPSEEVATLVDHAMGALGASRFAILYPRDAYGRGLRRLFWEAVEERGGSVVGVASYEPEANDFGEPIRRLLGYTLLSPGEKEALRRRDEVDNRARRLPPDQGAALREKARAMTGPGGQPLPPIVDFDALFIPESQDKVVLIAPQLAFHEAVGMRLLGPNGWYGPELVKIAREHVEGARFTAHFYSDSELPVVREFRGRFEDAFATPPDVFAAQAYDATNLVLVQLARGRETREAVREGVLAVTAYPGVSGVLTMRADGNARKRPYLLGVEGGRVTQIE
jgi:ABC-type branched-subunit amino acid transport system substrate-binding protein